MITKPNNWDDVRAYSGSRQKLPAGAYVCDIIQAVVQSNNYGQQLCVLLDINSGEWAGYYAEDFGSNQREDKKWKGVLRLWLPVNDGSDKDEFSKSILKGFITAVEESNRGYTWNWDERTLAKKEIGILFRNEEWEWNGKSGWTAKPFRAISVDSVEDGNFTIPNDKPLKNKATSTDSFGGFSNGYSAESGYSNTPTPTPGYDDFSMMQGDDSQLPF